VSIVTPHEVTALAVTNYHASMTERAREALTTARSDERHYCAVTVAVPESMLPTLKRELASLQERLLEMCDGAEGPRERVLQLNLHLFPLSQRIPTETPR
jgi:uncharacterized protein (TIGR02147 family)